MSTEHLRGKERHHHHDHRHDHDHDHEHGHEHHHDHHHHDQDHHQHGHDHHDHDHHHGHSHHHHDHDHDHDHDHHHDHGDEYGHEYDIYPAEFIKLFESPEFQGKVIDVREDWEYQKVRIEPSLSIPLRHLPERIGTLDRGEKYYIICSQGIRSSFAVEYMMESDFRDLHNVQSGIYGICDMLEDEERQVPWIVKE